MARLGFFIYNCPNSYAVTRNQNWTQVELHQTCGTFWRTLYRLSYTAVAMGRNLINPKVEPYQIFGGDPLPKKVKVNFFHFAVAYTRQFFNGLFIIQNFEFCCQFLHSPFDSEMPITRDKIGLAENTLYGDQGRQDNHGSWGTRLRRGYVFLKFSLKTSNCSGIT